MSRGYVPAATQTSRETGGWGLVLLDRAATAWGTQDDGRCVWFELAT